MKVSGRKILSFCAVAFVFVALLAVFGLNNLEGIRVAPFIQIAAMRRLIAIVAIVLGLGSSVVLLLQTGRQSRALGAVLVLMSVGCALVWGVGAARDSQLVRLTGVPQKGVVSIFSWNTGQLSVPEETIREVTSSSGADIIVLPELFQLTAESVLGVWAKENDYTIYSTESSTSSVLISNRLGQYTVSIQGVPPWAGFVAVPSEPDSPLLAVVHAEQTRLFNAGLWNQHLAWVAAVCADPNALVIGDFNTPLESLNSGALGSCSDVSAAVSSGAAGTWPTWLPAAVGSQIDRTMVGRSWEGESFGVIEGLDSAGSDHRPIAATVRRRG